MKKGFNYSLVTDLKENDLKDLVNLFHETVHSVNVNDYTKDQINVWVPERIDTEKWKRRIKNNFLFIAKDENKIIGFGELSLDGCIDMLYVHKSYLRQNVGQKLLKCLFRKAKDINLNEVFTEASITARPFFEKQGFRILKKQVKTVNDTDFVNYGMRKRI